MRNLYASLQPGLISGIRMLGFVAAVAVLALCPLGSAIAASNKPATSTTAKSQESRAAESLASVELAWKELGVVSSSRSELVRTAALKKYRMAVESFLLALVQLRELPEWKGTVMLASVGHRYALEIPAAPAGYKQYSINTFDSFLISSKVQIKSFKDPARTDGLGAPVVLRRMGKGEPFAYKSGYNCAATAVIDFQASGTGAVPKRATLRFYDPREQAAYAGYTLATDFAAPIEVGLNVSEFRNIQLGGVFSIDKFMTVRGLYLTEPYRPDKIPVIFTHGLQSSPLTWSQMINTLKADPEISRKYQFWYYTYPTGTGWTISAADFRADLNKAYAHFSAKGGSENLNRTVLVGHSMGGVMSRMMTIDSGDTFWNLAFNKPPSEVKWPNDEARERFTKVLFFKKVPMVAAAVFIAAPHRGSGMADMFVVGWIKKLIKLPTRLASAMVSVATLNVDSLKLNMTQGFGTGTSANGLSPKNPAYKAMNSCVIRVPFYTIIGDRKRGSDLLKYPNPRLLAGNDMIVPYWSSHLDEAVSEKIIRAGHTFCTTYDASLIEVRRILAERLAGNLGKAPTRPAGLMGPNEKPEEAQQKRKEGKPVKMKNPTAAAPRQIKAPTGSSSNLASTQKPGSVETQSADAMSSQSR
ncbi:MAG TPA: alpha/beta hydrolase [Candidatus Methylacidiphilales bacterium]|nr:alpha/beta hydrolase [Candidatus Methylacidiphilales bacterium]